MIGGNKPSISLRKYIKRGVRASSLPNTASSINSRVAGQPTLRTNIASPPLPSQPSLSPNHADIHVPPNRTLVLTSPLKSFVDIRIFTHLPDSSSSSPLPKESLEWAFAGTSFSTPATHSKPTHTVWNHWIDSTTVNADEVRDEGDMFVLDTGETVEKGANVDPVTGEVEYYEESWDDIEPRGEAIGWVLKVEGWKEKRAAKGMIVRIGELAQGLLRIGDEIGVRRWKLDGDLWKTEAGIGTFDTPGGVLEGQNMRQGDRVRSDDGLEWECVEMFSWS